MRSLCSLGCLAACTFGSPEAGPGPVPDPDAPSASDAAAGDASVDAAQEWTVVEQLAVPVTGATVASTFVLEAGVRYRLRASGVFVIQSPQGTPADAEYWNFNVPPPTDGVAGVDVGLAVNDTVVDETRTPRWGPYSASHIYEVDWTGDGAAIVAQLHDGNFANNTGMLNLAILAPQ
jgi:hypothetical protein